MGNNVHELSDAIAYIASDELWIEGSAIQQLHTTANLPGMHRVVGMPDLHPGRGYPIGAAFFLLIVFILPSWVMTLVAAWRCGKRIS